MIAMTRVSDRPVTDAGGTTGAVTFILRPRSLLRAGARNSRVGSIVWVASV